MEKIIEIIQKYLKNGKMEQENQLTEEEKKVFRNHFSFLGSKDENIIVKGTENHIALMDRLNEKEKQLYDVLSSFIFDEMAAIREKTISKMEEEIQKNKEKMKERIVEIVKNYTKQEKVTAWIKLLKKDKMTAEKEIYKLLTEKEKQEIVMFYESDNFTMEQTAEITHSFFIKFNKTEQKVFVIFLTCVVEKLGADSLSELLHNEKFNELASDCALLFETILEKRIENEAIDGEIEKGLNVEEVIEWVKEHVKNEPIQSIVQEMRTRRNPAKVACERILPNSNFKDKMDLKTIFNKFADEPNVPEPPKNELWAYYDFWFAHRSEIKAEIEVVKEETKSYKEQLKKEITNGIQLFTLFFTLLSKFTIKKDRELIKAADILNLEEKYLFNFLKDSIIEEETEDSEEEEEQDE